MRRHDTQSGREQTAGWSIGKSPARRSGVLRLTKETVHASGDLARALRKPSASVLHLQCLHRPRLRRAGFHNNNNKRSTSTFRH